MRKITLILLTALITPFLLADGHGAPKMDALEVFGCEFKKGRDLGDFLRVSNKWDSWADENHSKPYTGYVMTPYAFNGDDSSIDLVWLGVAEDHQAMGIINDEWDREGAQLSREFESVCATKMHMYFTSIEVRAFPETESPTRLTAWACEFEDGKGFADLASADAAWNAHMAEVGMPGGIYRWFPGAGYPRASTHDYIQVYVTASNEDYGKTTDMMWSGSFPVFQKTYGEIQNCDNSRMWASQWSGSVE